MPTIKQLIRNARQPIRNVTKSPALGGCPQRRGTCTRVYVRLVQIDRLRINQYSIDWSEVIDKKDLSKSLRFFLSKLLLFLSKLLLFLSNSLPFFFVSFGNIPIHRSEIDLVYLDKNISIKNIDNRIGSILLVKDWAEFNCNSTNRQ